MTQPLALLVKVLRADEWTRFRAEGRYEGSADDRRDGFIHLSAPEQLAGTIARHFDGAKDLIAAELVLDGDPALRWEPSRDGRLFPHLYRPLLITDVTSARPVGLQTQ